MFKCIDHNSFVVPDTWLPEGVCRMEFNAVGNSAAVLRSSSQLATDCLSACETNIGPTKGMGLDQQAGESWKRFFADSISLIPSFYSCCS